MCKAQHLPSPTKCGEVFIHAGDFYFICKFCEKQSYGFRRFKNHMKINHPKAEYEDIVLKQTTQNIDLHEDSSNEAYGDNLESLAEEESDDQNYSKNILEGSTYEEDPIKVELKDEESDETGKSPTVTIDNTTKMQQDNEEVPELQESIQEFDKDNEADKVSTTNDLTEEDDVSKNLKSEGSNAHVEVDTVDENHGTTSPTTETNQTAYCTICRRKYRSMKNYLKHKTRHEVVSEDDENDGSKGSKTSNLRVPKGSSLKCRFCGQQFRSREHRVDHERTHTGDKPYKCHLCPKYFRLMNVLLNHLLTHSEERSFKCHICPQAFKNKSNLNVHIRSHLGIKKFECEDCGKKFLRNVERKIHMRSHTGEKPHQCEHCGKRFTTSPKLYEHRNRHTNTRPYECQVCSKRFYSRGLLRDHQKGHSEERPHTCNICNKSFARKKTLTCHMKIHSDVKEYVCNICEKAFAQRPGLICHMKTHKIY